MLKRFLVTVFFVSATSPAWGVPILDQINGPAVPGFGGPALVDVQHIGQSVTVGSAGLLALIDVQIYKSTGTVGDVTLAIRELSGVNLGTVLFSTIISLAAIPTHDSTDTEMIPWTQIDITSGGLFFGAGDVFAIELVRNEALVGPPWVVWSALPGYAGGRNYLNGAPGNFSGADQSFRSWMDANPLPAAVPEPGTLGLLSAGLLGLAFARRKKAA